MATKLIDINGLARFKEKHDVEIDAKISNVTIQVSTMPTAASALVGKIYQYIGTTTSNYIKGYFYQCVEDSSTNPSTYSWVNINVQSGGGQTIQVTSLPTASSTEEGNIYWYIGTTTNSYTHGYIYECIEDPNNSGSYIWSPIEVQASSGGSSGAVQSVKIGSSNTEYNNSGNVVLPAYPTSVTVLNKTATLLSSSWVGNSAPYSQAVTVTNILATDTPFIDLAVSSTAETGIAELENWSYVSRAVTSANTITFYCYEGKPEVNLSVTIKVVR